MEGITLDRYIVTTASGQPVVRTSSAREAARYQHVLRGRIIDRQAPAAEPVRTLAVAS